MRTRAASFQHTTCERALETWGTRRSRMGKARDRASGKIAGPRHSRPQSRVLPTTDDGRDDGGTQGTSSPRPRRRRCRLVLGWTAGRMRSAPPRSRTRGTGGEDAGPSGRGRPRVGRPGDRTLLRQGARDACGHAARFSRELWALINDWSPPTPSAPEARSCCCSHSFFPLHFLFKGAHPSRPGRAPRGKAGIARDRRGCAAGPGGEARGTRAGKRGDDPGRPRDRSGGNAGLGFRGRRSMW